MSKSLVLFDGNVANAGPPVIPAQSGGVQLYAVLEYIQ